MAEYVANLPAEAQKYLAETVRSLSLYVREVPSA